MRSVVRLNEEVVGAVLEHPYGGAASARDVDWLPALLQATAGGQEPPLTITYFCRMADAILTWFLRTAFSKILYRVDLSSALAVSFNSSRRPGTRDGAAPDRDARCLDAFQAAGAGIRDFPCALDPGDALRRRGRACLIR